MADNHNENSQITDIAPQNENNTLPAELTQEEKLIRNLFIHKTVNEAAIAAGYSPKTASGYIYTKIKNERFKRKVQQYAIDNDIMSLPKIAYIENKVLEHLMDNPLDVAKFKHITKQKKQVAGILGQDIPFQGPTINITAVQNLMLQMHEGMKQISDNDNIVNAETDTI